MKRLFLLSPLAFAAACLPPAVVDGSGDTGACTLVPWYDDLDGDGHGDGAHLSMRCAPDPGQVGVGDDCDDQNTSVWAWQDVWIDADGDGYGDANEAVRICGEAGAGTAAVDGDCNDANSAAYPGAEIACGDGVDNNCDGETDCPVPSGTRTSADADAAIAGADSEELGAALALARDASGDGLQDLLVGAPSIRIAPVAPGRVYLFSEPITGDISSTDGVALTGALVGDGAGSALSAGDLDGDGIDDLAIGAYTGGAAGEGAVYLAYGPISADMVLGVSSVTATLTGPNNRDLTGQAVICDLALGDGSAAGLLVGAPGDDSAGSNAGAVYRLAGPLSTGLVLARDADGILRGEIATDALGVALANLGDLDGDGVAEMAVSASKGHIWDVPLSDELGIVYLVPPTFTGDADVADVAAAWIYGPDFGAQFGASVAAAGDVDGDGAPDLLIGAPNADGDAGVNAGKVWLFSGPVAMTATVGAPADELLSLATFHGDSADQQLGTVVAGVGDLDVDGADDVGLGVPFYTGSAVGLPDETGAVMVWYGGVSGVETPADATLLLRGQTAHAHLGAALLSLGDVNSLGVPDLAVGAPGDPDEDATSSAAYVLMGDGF